MAGRKHSKKKPFATEVVRQKVRATYAAKKAEKGEVLAPQKREVRGSAIDREDAFLAVYLNNGMNGTRAVLDCGVFECSTPDAAGVRAAALLRRERVQEKILAFKRAYAERYSVTQERITAELAACAFANMADYLTIQDDGSAVVDLRLVRDPIIGRQVGAAISSIETETYIDGYEDKEREIPINVKRVKFRLHDKLEALNLLAKATGHPSFAPISAQQSNFNIQNLQVIYNATEQKLLGGAA